MRAKARSYFLIGADREDIVQEGMIGLYKAIRDYKGDKLASFKAFAELMYNKTNYYSNKNSNKTETYSFEFLCVVGQANL